MSEKDIFEYKYSYTKIKNPNFLRQKNCRINCKK